MADPIVEAFPQIKVLEEMLAQSPNNVARLQHAMSVLVYRLNKLIANTTPPKPYPLLQHLVDQDRKTWKFAAGADTRYFDIAASLLCNFNTGMVAYVNQYIGWGLKVRVEHVDMMGRQQAQVMHMNPNKNDKDSSWGRNLPFRALFCNFATFAMAFPVQQGIRSYEDYLKQEDAIPDQVADKKRRVRMDKQRTFATCLDALDYTHSYWLSPIKSEVAYDIIKHSVYKDAAPASGQRPKRIGNCYWRKPKGSMSPDFVIVRHPRKAPDPDNVSHCVDMKFPGDGMGFDQRDNYHALFPNRLYVFYFPTDCTVIRPKEVKIPQEYMAYAAAAALIMSLIAKRPIKPGNWGPMPLPAY